MRLLHWFVPGICILWSAGSVSAVRLSASPLSQTTFISPSGPLDRGIQSLRDTQQRRRTQIEQLQAEAAERVTSIAEIAYEAYGHDKDPVHQLVELKSYMDEALELIRAGRMGEVSAAIGRGAQIALDVASDSNQSLKHINAAQQVMWELADAGQILLERSARQAEAARDDKILRWLEAKNETLAKTRIRTPPVDQRPPKTVHGGLNGAALDESERLQRWLDLGNRAFDNQAEEERFYRDYPALRSLKEIAESRSPLDEAAEMDADMDALRIIEKAYSETRRREAALKEEHERRAQDGKELGAAESDLRPARDDEKRASPAERLVIPDDVLRRAVPRDWVPCECPGRHPNAGLRIDGARWHTPAIDCSMVF